MKNVLKYEDLALIEQFLRENEMDNGEITIVMNIRTQQRLNRINSDYYYKMHGNQDNNANKLENVDSINVNIGNVKFVYKLPDNDTDNQE